MSYGFSDAQIAHFMRDRCYTSPGRALRGLEAAARREEKELIKKKIRAHKAKMKKKNKGDKK